MSRSALAAAREAYRLASDEAAAKREVSSDFPSGVLTPREHLARAEARLALAKAEWAKHEAGVALAALLDAAEPRLDAAPLESAAAKIREAERALQEVREETRLVVDRARRNMADVAAERVRDGLPKPLASATFGSARSLEESIHALRTDDTLTRQCRNSEVIMRENERNEARRIVAQQELKAREAAAREAEARRDIERQRETIAAQDRERNARVAADERAAREALDAEARKLFPEAP
jgi:hypothetical protein